MATLIPDESKKKEEARAIANGIGKFARYKGKNGKPIFGTAELQAVLAKQLLRALEPEAGWENTPLTRLASPLSEQAAQEKQKKTPPISIKAETDKQKDTYGDGKLTISKETLQKLSDSAQLVTNPKMMPPALFLKIQTTLINSIKTQDNRSLKAIINSTPGESSEAWLNDYASLGFQDRETLEKVLEDSIQILASNICHSQEVHFFVEQELYKDNGVEYSGNKIRTENLTPDSTPTVLLSTPGLNFYNGPARHLLKDDKGKEKAKALISNMWEGVLESALRQNCRTLAMPAIGLGVFVADKDRSEVAAFYFEALRDLLKSEKYKGKFDNIFFNPVQCKDEFDAVFTEAEKSKLNIQKFSGDVKFLSVALAQKNIRCALLNPSDADVVLGKYDVGEYYKEVNPDETTENRTYVGEEDIGATSTAAIGSREITRNLYTNKNRIFSTDRSANLLRADANSTEAKLTAENIAQTEVEPPTEKPKSISSSQQPKLQQKKEGKPKIKKRVTFEDQVPEDARDETKQEAEQTMPKSAASATAPAPTSAARRRIAQVDLDEIRNNAKEGLTLYLKSQYADLPMIDRQIEILEHPHNPGTSPRVVGALFLGAHHAMQKENLPPHIPTMGFDSNDHAVNNLEMFKQFLNRINKDVLPKTLFIPIGAHAHMVGMRVEFLKDGPPKILYFNSYQANKVYPGTEKFIQAVADVAIDKGFCKPDETAILRVVPTVKLQRDDEGPGPDGVGRGYCGHWVTWFYRECLKQNNMDFDKLTQHFNALQVPQNLDMIHNIRQDNLVLLKNYREELRQLRANVGLSQQAIDTREGWENAAAISQYIESANASEKNNTIEITFKPGTDPMLKRYAYYAMQNELFKKIGTVPALVLQPADKQEIEFVNYQVSVLADPKDPKKAKLSIKGATQQNTNTITIFEIIGPTNFLEMQDKKNPLKLRITNDHIFSTAELTRAFKTFKDIYERSYDNKAAPSLKECSGIIIENAASLSTLQRESLREAYTAVFEAELLKTSGLEQSAAPAVTSRASTASTPKPSSDVDTDAETISMRASNTAQATAREQHTQRLEQLQRQAQQRAEAERQRMELETKSRERIAQSRAAAEISRDRPVSERTLYSHYQKTTNQSFAKTHQQLIELRKAQADADLTEKTFQWLNKELHNANVVPLAAQTSAAQTSAAQTEPQTPHPLAGVTLKEGSTAKNLTLEIPRSDGTKDKLTQAIDKENNLTAKLHGPNPEDRAYIILALTNAPYQPLDLQYNPNLHKVIKIMEACVLNNVEIVLDPKNIAQFKDPACPKDLQTLYAQLTTANGQQFKEYIHNLHPDELNKRHLGAPLLPSSTPKLGMG